MEKQDKKNESYNDGLPGMMLRSVGIVRSKIKKPLLAAHDDGIRMQERMESARAKIREVRKSVSEIVIHEDLIRCVISHLLENIRSSPKVSVIYLSNQMHWIYCLKGEIRLENMNALPLPMIRIPK